MNPADEPAAWLEQDEQQHILEGNCSIGRATLNAIVLASPKVSRLHAIVQYETPGVFWLIDLGSSNGTFLNKRRIHEPVRLRDQDHIAIGGNILVFRQSHGAPEKPTSTIPIPTLQEKIEDMPCWLLVADIKDFTALSRQLDSGKLATLVSSWLATCTAVIEKNEGAVNKYLGDGILAYWHDDKIALQKIVAVISALKEAQLCGDTTFRFVMHYGLVAVGGVTAVREETLMGSEVNLVFRLEKLAASIGESCGVSEAVQAKMEGLIPMRRIGEFELKGFERKRAFFAV